MSFISVLVEAEMSDYSCWSYYVTVALDQSACRDAHLQCREVVLLSSYYGDGEGEARISEYVPSDLSCCQ
jgi:hypothetical protein